jgi:hypothetical protein
MCEEHDATVTHTFHLATIDDGIKCRNCIGGRSYNAKAYAVSRRKPTVRGKLLCNVLLKFKPDLSANTTGKINE